MPVSTVAQLIPVLQTAIGSVILMSAVGLLSLTMNNRLGRAIDRARVLSSELATATGNTRAKIAAQLRILWRRSHLIRQAIARVSMSALAAAVLIIVLFFTALLQLETAWLISLLFILCMACLILSLGIFIQDVNQSLAAVKLELSVDGFNGV